MKGKDCCERCYFFSGEYISDSEGFCFRFPKQIVKYKEGWCGEFKNNNAHFNKADDDD